MKNYKVVIMASSALKFDTLAVAKELESAGVPTAQAEAQTRVYAKVIELAMEDTVATKVDLKQVEASLTKKIELVDSGVEHLKQEVKHLDQKIDMVNQKVDQKFDALDQKINTVNQSLQEKIESTSLRLTIRLGGLIAIGIAILAAIIKL